MDGNYDNQEQNQSLQDVNQNRPDQSRQDAGRSQPDQNWQNPNRNPYYGEYGNGGYNGGYNSYGNGYPNGSGYPNGGPYPNGGYPGGSGQPQGYPVNNGYNSYASNGYNGPIIASNAVPNKGGGLAVGSLVCGVVSIICFWSIITFIAAIVGLVLGIVNNVQNNSNKGLAIVGIITNCLAILLTAAFVIFVMAAL